MLPAKGPENTCKVAQHQETTADLAIAVLTQIETNDSQNSQLFHVAG